MALGPSLQPGPGAALGEPSGCFWQGGVELELLWGKPVLRPTCACAWYPTMEREFAAESGHLRGGRLDKSLPEPGRRSGSRLVSRP